ncbi:MAG: outer membrane protein assembly factor BamB [Rhodoferax sp.]|nr:outer membrane protein assembly factor BamB [Rhodoferax sp.]
MLAMLVGTLVACAGPGKPKPADLGPNTQLIGVRSAWSTAIGKVDFPLHVQVVGDLLFAAGSDGVVAAIDARTGGDVWRMALGTSLSAGVGSDGRYVAVVSRENELITVVGGREVWRQKLNAVTLTAPFVAGDRIFVLSTDRSIFSFDAASGRKLWQQQQRSGDALVLGQAGIIFAVGDTLVAGLGGRLVGMNPQNGNVRWDAPIANSRGTNEVERLVDVVAGLSRVGDQVCVRAFQSAVGCVDADKGRVVWIKPASGSTGVHGDETMVLGTESDGKILAWRRTDGERLWTSERLRYRSLTAPLVAGRSVVVGDDSGTLHFLSRQDGEPLNRVTTDGAPLAAAPVLIGQTIVAVTQRGGIFGFRPE